jgi:dipeptidyl aminopeptidase/acylaminoacyl peptidase
VSKEPFLLLALVSSLTSATFSSLAQDAGETFGGVKGADLSIEAMEPDDEKVHLELAGEYPAGIARYLLAGGAGYADLSPDGKSIAFTWDVTGERELWVMPSSGGQPKQVTFKTGVSTPWRLVDDLFWTPDGKSLFYAADLNGNEQPGYFTITSDGMRGLSVLPSQRGDFRVFGDFTGSDGFLYASTARGAGVFDLYRASMDGKTELIVESDSGLLAVFSVSPDGTYAVVVEAVGADANNLYLLDLSTTTLTPISQPDIADRASHTLGGFEWTPDSSFVYFSTNVGREYGALSRYEIATRRIETVIATDADIENIELCGTRGELVAYTENRDGFDRLLVRNRNDLSERRIQNLPEGTYQLDCEGDKSPQLLVNVSGWKTPGELWMVDPLKGTGEKAFAANLAGINPDTLVRPQVVRYPARDGVELQGLLYLPHNGGRGDSAPPVIFSVHGGPSAQSQATFNPTAQYLVNRGFAVFQPNIRGSTGLGRTYSTLDDRENRLDSVRDLVDLLDALAADGLVDADRALVEGYSYGGYAVNAVLAEHPNTFKAGVSGFGVGDWVNALEIASPALKATDRIEYGDIAEASWREFYKINSPIRKANKIKVPVLYSHGAMDPRIDISETETMVKALRTNGIEAPFIRFPDEGHGWRKLSNRIFYYQKMADFLEKQLMLNPSK